MLAALLDLGLFTAKSFVIFIVIALLLAIFFALLARGKQKNKGKLCIKHLNKKYKEAADLLLAEILPKKALKVYLKNKKAEHKSKSKSQAKPSTVYVLNFNGDIRASAVASLREEINTILSANTLPDEVIVNIESAGGMVHAYGLAAAQLMRLRAANIPLTATIDKVAASGGYLMACVADKILAAPFAIIGSIGVIVQIPNFNRLLKEHHIDYEQLTAGEFKRTLTVFGENTKEGKEKLQEEIEDIQDLFKALITTHRPQIDIDKVATGEHWLGQQAIELKLIDGIKTSDDYLLDRMRTAALFEICYEVKKPFLSKLSSAGTLLLAKLSNFQRQIP